MAEPGAATAGAGVKRLIAMVSTTGKSPEVVAAELLDAWKRSTAASAAPAAPAGTAGDDAPDDTETIPDAVR